MKRKVLLSFALLCAISSVISQDFSINGVNYTITSESNSTVAISSNSCYEGDLVLSEKVTNDGKDYTLTAINAFAFGNYNNGCTSLSSITLPNTVESIGQLAFYKCSNLTRVDLGNSINSIGDNAFSYNYSLSEIVLNVAEPFAINENVFTGISESVISLKVPEESKNEFATHDSWKYFSIYGNFTVDNINSRILDNSKNVELISGSCNNGELEIGSQVYHLGNFYNIIGIGKYAFWKEYSSCTGAITSLIIPNTITYIEESAFRDNTELTSISIGNGLESIGKFAFRNNSSLTDFSIDVEEPISLSYTYAFDDIILNNVTLNVPEGSENAYADAYIWDEFSIFGSFTINGVNYLITDNNSNTVSITEKSCFDGDLDLSNGIEYNGVLYTIISVNENAFGGSSIDACTSLTSIVLPDSLTTIEARAFGYCSALESVTIGSGLEYLGVNAFINNTSLAEFNINIEQPLYITFRNVFTGVDLSNVSLNVPAGFESLYEASGIWEDFGNVIVLSSEDNVFSESKLSIYVDEQKDLLKLHSTEKFKDLSVYNVSGQQLKRTNSKEVCISDLSSGIYIARVRTNKGSISKRILKK